MQASPPNFPVYPTGFLTRKSAETVRQQNPPPPPLPPPYLTRKLSGKAFIPRSAITIKIVNKYIHHPKIAALKIVQNMPNKY